MPTVIPPAHVAVEDACISDDTLRQFMGYHLKRASNAVLGDLARVLKPFDLRMITYTALVLIVDNPGLRQSQLADAMDIERPNLVVILDELEQRDLIVRDTDPRDRRAYALRATSKGRALYDRSVRAVKAHERVLLQGIPPEARTLVVQAAVRLQRNAKGIET